MTIDAAALATASPTPANAAPGADEPGRPHDGTARGFASDNYSGVHPEVLAALAAVNHGHQVAYGDDDHTLRLQAVFQRHFGDQTTAYPVFNGTGANVVGLQAATNRWGAVICADSAHINVDECGAPEKVGGLKLLTVPTRDGKLTPELIDREARGFTDEHRAQPQVVSVTQTTELGTAYSIEELRAICEHAHALGMR
ncbi:MAG: threonine aldolase family protein, partial [Nocardioides sp.]